MRAQALRLIQQMTRAVGGAFGPGDWEGCLPRARMVEGQWTLAPLMLVARYYPATIPSTLFAEPRVSLVACPAHAPATGGCLWSKIRIEAFPGVEWSRTLGRHSFSWAAEFPKPSRALSSVGVEGRCRSDSDADTIPWYGISHGARIVRWIFSRPPRVQTLLSVRLALVQQP
jgi:hypothetical protein